MGSLAERLKKKSIAPIAQDPRPDLEEDSELWEKLLGLARREAPEVFHVLHGFRCAGTRIRQGQKGYVLRPDVGQHDWDSQKAYEEMRDKWLRPHRDSVARLLTSIR